jgi:hypothetical protein
LELLDEPENPGVGLALHREPIVEILFHDEVTIPVDVHMARGVISLPGEKHEPATPDLRHGVPIPRAETVITPGSECPPTTRLPWLRHNGLRIS